MLRFFKKCFVLFFPLFLSFCTLLEHVPYPPFERPFVRPEAVKFSAVGLNWGVSDSDSMNWRDAKQHCQNLGKRLPTRKELKDLSKKRKELYGKLKNQKPHRVLKSCRRGIYCYYWSSTPVKKDPYRAWGVDVGNGDSYQSLKHFYDGYVICVK
ncbi:MAG: DUF1566 domain-containing protein [Leptospiraceae bacterium]|nr:DUF1566 domain-containing protein [Leptospiraceae bacterium]